MKIQQWKWQQSKFDNENSTIKIWQWKFWQWKFDNENANNEINLAKNSKFQRARSQFTDIRVKL